jgi:hypothetical protein
MISATAERDRPAAPRNGLAVGVDDRGRVDIPFVRQNGAIPAAIPGRSRP